VVWWSEDFWVSRERVGGARRLVRQPASQRLQRRRSLLRSPGRVVGEVDWYKKRNRSHTQTHNKNNTTHDTEEQPRVSSAEGASCTRLYKDQQVTQTHTDREQHPRHRHTHAHDEDNTPNKHLPQVLNNARRWRDDGACHLPRPGGWPRRSQRER